MYRSMRPFYSCMSLITDIGFPWVDGLSTGPPGFGASQLGIRA